MHDMALTDKHIIFLDLPLVFEAERMAKGQLPVVFDKTAEARYESQRVCARGCLLLLFCVFPAVVTHIQYSAV